MTVKLSPQDNVLFGQYGDEDDVIVLCDATDNPFTVVIPDATTNESAIFRITKTDSSANVVTLNPFGNQTLVRETSQEIYGQGDLIILKSDLENWV